MMDVQTYQDAVDYLIDVFEIQDDGVLKRHVLRSIDNTFRKLSRNHYWSYYNTWGRISTEAAQTTGAVAYDHTGGPAERLLTISGETWPENVIFGEVVVNGIVYKIESRLSSTQVTLVDGSSPVADIASATYRWFRYVYPLPCDCVFVGAMYDDTEKAEIPQSTLGSVIRHHSYNDQTPDWPREYAIIGGSENVGQWSIAFGSPPDAARDYVFSYFRSMRQLKVLNRSAGDVTGTAGSNAVLGSGAGFKATDVGAVIRFTSSTTVLPTGNFGSLISGDHVFNPYDEQRVIVQVLNDDNILLDSNLSYSYSGTKYVISDPIDVDYVVMWDYCLAQMEADYASLKGLTKIVKDKVASARLALIRAKEADQKSESTGGVSSMFVRTGRLAVTPDDA